MVNAERERLNRPMTLGGIAVALVIYLLWGGNNVAIKIAIAAIPPLTAAGIRFAQALVIIAAWAWLRRVSLRPRPGELRALASLAAVFWLQIALLNVAQKYTNAVRGTVFLASHPLFIGLFAHLRIPGDRLRGAKLAGLSLAFLGIIVTFAEHLFDTGGVVGDALMLVSAVLLGLRSVLLKEVAVGIPVERTLFWQFALAVPVFFLAGLGELGAWRPVGPRELWAMIFQGVVIAGFGFAGNAWLLDRFRASEVAAWTFTTPLWGVLLCVWILGEPLTGWVVAGTVLVAVGIALASRAE